MKGWAKEFHIAGVTLNIESNPLICVYCKRQLSQICLESCSKEALFRYLAPMQLDESKSPPGFPNMETLLKLNAEGRLALIMLVLHYWAGETRSLQVRQ